MARVAGADESVATDAGPGLAGISLRAQVSVAARGPVRLGRVRTRAGRGVAGPGVVRLILGRTGDRIGPCAGPRLAGVHLGTEILIVAARAVRLRGARAQGATQVADRALVRAAGVAADA